MAASPKVTPQPIIRRSPASVKLTRRSVISGRTQLPLILIGIRPHFVELQAGVASGGDAWPPSCSAPSGLAATSRPTSRSPGIRSRPICGSPCTPAIPPIPAVRPTAATRPIEASKGAVGYVRNT